MPDPFVSVLIDSFNHERFIEKAVTSVLDQDFPASRFEVLVIDDGSTDSTPEIVRKFAPRVRYLRKENGGQGSAFNAGIPECKGEIVAFLDADDWWQPAKLTTVVEAFSRNPQIGSIGHGFSEVDESGNLLAQIVPSQQTVNFLRDAADAREFLSLRAFLGTSRLAIRRSILQRVLPLPLDLIVEADEFMASVATVLGGALILDQCLTAYRIHSGNLFQFTGSDPSRSSRKYRSLNCIVQDLPAHLEKAGAAPEVAKVLAGSVFVDAERLRLSSGFGWPWNTVHVEREAFRQNYSASTVSYRLFHAAVLTVAAVLPPRVFYRLRNWYAARNLSRYRKMIGEAEPVSSVAVRRDSLP